MPAKTKYNNGYFKLGDRYGKLIIIDEVIYKNKHKQSVIKCQCECENKVEIQCSQLENNISYNQLQCFHCSHFKGYKAVPLQFLTNKISAKNWEVNVDCEFIYNLWIRQNKKCALSGLDISFENVSSIRSYSCTASLDRIDSSKSYDKDNVQLVHKHINIMKNDHDQQYFINLCQLITNYNKM
jgi:hypothetical protein